MSQNLIGPLFSDLELESPFRLGHYTCKWPGLYGSSCWLTLKVYSTPKDVIMEGKAGIELFDDIISIINDPIHITLKPESSHATSCFSSHGYI